MVNVLKLLRIEKRKLMRLAKIQRASESKTRRAKLAIKRLKADVRLLKSQTMRSLLSKAGRLVRSKATRQNVKAGIQTVKRAGRKLRKAFSQFQDFADKIG